MSFEKPKENTKEKNIDAEAEEKTERFLVDTDTIKVSIENRTDQKLPDDNEELFNNFDKYVPEDMLYLTWISEKGHPVRYSREGIKSQVEKEIYGADTSYQPSGH